MERREIGCSGRGIATCVIGVEGVFKKNAFRLSQKNWPVYYQPSRARVALRSFIEAPFV